MDHVNIMDHNITILVNIIHNNKHHNITTNKVCYIIIPDIR